MVRNWGEIENFNSKKYLSFTVKFLTKFDTNLGHFEGNKNTEIYHFKIMITSSQQANPNNQGFGGKTQVIALRWGSTSKLIFFNT